MPLSPSQISLRGRVGAYTLHSTHSPVETTQKARSTFLAKFLEGIDPSLPEAERERRAQAAKKAHFARLALRSAQVRSKRKNGDASPQGVAVRVMEVNDGGTSSSSSG